jgi:hypothetical protein
MVHDGITQKYFNIILVDSDQDLVNISRKFDRPQTFAVLEISHPACRQMD